jgi:hypothetical protein
MRADGRMFTALLFLLLCAFGAGVYSLLHNRFERGDDYPPFSTFRSDPDGTRAFYLALGRLPGMEARRNFLEPDRLPQETGTTFFFLGVDPVAMRAITKKDMDALERLARRGNRLVFAFAPAMGGKGRGEGGDNGGDPPGNASGRKTGGRPDGAPCGCLSWRWNVILYDTPPGKAPRAGVGRAIPAPGEKGLPAGIPLRSSLVFRPDGNYWRTVYSVGGEAVLIERPLGRGSMVMLADAYPASNAAMPRERYPALLLRLLGGNRTAVFDETHLGVVETPGMIWLVKKYRLAGFFAALLLLAGLFVWKNSIPLAPRFRPGRGGDGGIITDRDAMGGLISLLRRNIPRPEILDICFREWTKSFSREYRQGDATWERMKLVVERERSKPPAKRDAAAGYSAIARILEERKRA